MLRTSDRILIVPVQRPEFPFDTVSVDIICRIEPPSARKHKYVLCLVDLHSRWPEAVPLRTITAKSTCASLLEIFMRTDIPRVRASDQGTNFVAELTQELYARLGASPRFATPGHPQSSGLVEWYNQVLKRMLHHIVRNGSKN
ncbi:uncharacterized protein LOC118200402 [Stegodyphus dumicola]|uniref:uncharacterized protein LOC118200402 n=1 Tax=Stegodyphus dumicola TaxID=202533 RepID=UPI0015AB1977|nr:uncharacterized protein LOC118200402 [Stegodyphus dumicola]